jgi:hypothetical protein
MSTLCLRLHHRVQVWMVWIMMFCYCPWWPANLLLQSALDHLLTALLRIAARMHRTKQRGKLHQL